MFYNLLLITVILHINGRSYRVPGIVSPGQRVAVFDLTKAKMIERDESHSYQEQQ